jgi:hypothetical protein
LPSARPNAVKRPNNGPLPGHNFRWAAIVENRARRAGKSRQPRRMRSATNVVRLCGPTVAQLSQVVATRQQLVNNASEMKGFVQWASCSLRNGLFVDLH